MSEDVMEKEQEIQAEVENTIKNMKVEADEEDLTPLSDDEKELSGVLANEFREFVEQKVGLKEDIGERVIIPTGIDLLDAVLGGGFVVGTMSIIVGQPGSGKSMLAMQTFGQAQKQFDGNMLGGYLDSEEAVTQDRLAMLGVNNPPMSPYNNITVEKVFKFIEGMCTFKQLRGIVDSPSMVVWDSVANTLTEKEHQIEDPNAALGYKTRLLSLLVPKYLAKCNQYNICLIAINQLRDQLAMGPMAPANELKMMTYGKRMPGGNILKFNAFHLIEMKVKSVISEGAKGAKNNAETYGFDGIIASLKCIKNKLFRPNIEISLVGSFLHGFSNFWTNYNFLKETSRIKVGAWNYLVSYPEKKFRTKDAHNLYTNDETFRAKFDETVKEALKTEIIDRYATPELGKVTKEQK